MIIVPSSKPPKPEVFVSTGCRDLDVKITGGSVIKYEQDWLVVWNVFYRMG